MTALLFLTLLAQVVPGAVQQAKGKAKASAKPASVQLPPPLCTGDYADALPVEKANAILDGVKEQYVFAIRNTATYEHVYYGHDGKLRRAYLRSTVHRTRFALRGAEREAQNVTHE